MDALFDLPESPSPRLVWITEHKLVICHTHLPWSERPMSRFLVGRQEWWPGLKGRVFFEEEFADHSDRRSGVGMTEADAIWDFCRKNNVKHYTE